MLKQKMIVLSREPMKKVATVQNFLKQLKACLILMFILRNIITLSRLKLLLVTEKNVVKWNVNSTGLTLLS